MGGLKRELPPSSVGYNEEGNLETAVENEAPAGCAISSFRNSLSCTLRDEAFPSASYTLMGDLLAVIGHPEGPVQLKLPLAGRRISCKLTK